MYVVKTRHFVCYLPLLVCFCIFLSGVWGSRCPKSCWELPHFSAWVECFCCSDGKFSSNWMALLYAFHVNEAFFLKLHLVGRLSLCSLNEASFYRFHFEWPVKWAMMLL